MTTLSARRDRPRAIAVGLLLAAVLGLLGLAPTQQEPPSFPLPMSTSKPATLTFDQLREGIKQHHKDLWALEVDYEFRSSANGSLKAHFAYKGEKRLRDQVDSDGRAYGQTYSDSAQIWDRLVKSASFEVAKEPWVDRDPYAAALRLGIPDEHRALGLSLTSLVDHQNLKWFVKPTLDIVDGAECHVLECPEFLAIRVWIDPRIGFAMRFQETHQTIKGRPQAEWPLLGRYCYRDFEKIPPGVYLPRKIEILAYTEGMKPQSTWNQVTDTQTLKATKLVAGQNVDDSLFRFVFSPGTTVQDRVSKRFYRIGKMGEELDMLVGKGRQELAKGGAVRSRLMLLLIGNGALFLGIVGWVLHRRRQRSQA